MSAAARRRGGRGSKPRNALALGLRNVPFSFFPYTRKDSLLASFEVVLPAPHQQIRVRRQDAASGKII